MSMLTATATYNMVMKDLTKSLDRTGKEPTVQRDTAYYKENISKVKTVEEFLANDRLYRYAMKAHGLEDMIYAKAFMRKVLEEGVSSPKSFANKLADQRYRDFAKTFDFQSFGKATTVTEAAQQGTVDRFMRQTLEEDVGDQNEGARLAMYFQRKASGITKTMNLLGDSALLKVVQVAFGFDAATGAMDIEKQVAMIEKRLKVADLQDPVKLKAFLNRFTTMWETTQSSTDSYSASSAAAMLVSPVQSSGVGQTVTFSSDLLSAIQNLRRGGA